MVIQLAVVALLSLTSTNAEPTGTWKWSTERNGQKRETVLKLKLEDGKLTGTISGRSGETAIEKGAFKEGQVSFELTRERNGRKFTIKYSGKVGEKDIVGTSQFGDRSREWKAMRVVKEKEE